MRRSATRPGVLRTVIAHGDDQPDQVALKDQERALTYRELLEDVATLATGLKTFGVVEGDRVALLIPNSLDFVVGALACLWIGATFVPLTPIDPDARLAMIITDCRPVLVLALTRSGHNVSNLGDAPFETVAEIRARAEGLERAPALEDAPRTAYAIYTSGTTGTPKGVLIGTIAFAAAVRATASALSLTPLTRTLCVSPFHFDGSFGTLFPTLYVGGTVIIRPRDALLFARTFFHAVENEGVTYTGFSPSYLRLLLASPRVRDLATSTLEVIALGGEASSIADVRTLWAHAPALRVFNRYGPTETTIAVTHVHLTPELLEGGVMPMGAPHPDTTFVLVGEAGEIITERTTNGELYIGGDQLMEGYWGAPDLTAEVLRRDVVAGETLYRTGDLVYRDANDHFVYVDRVDRVIKRHGVRISLIELAESLRHIPSVTSAACVTYDLEGDLGIVAFVILDQDLSPLELFRAARRQLNETMVPDRFEVVTTLPLTTSSKLDERLLLANAGLRALRT